MFFLPLYDENYKIYGTQLLFSFKDTKIDAKVFELKNYSREDYSITNKYCMMGYKVYNLEIKGQDKQLFFDIRLQKNIDEHFTQFEKSIILNQ
jgi:hypothetical protein